MRVLYTLCLLAALATTASAQITVADGGGLWSDPATWSTNSVPTETDDVVIDSSVTLDIADAVARNVTIRGVGQGDGGSDAEGLLRTNRGFAENLAVGLTVFGDFRLVGGDAQFLPLSNAEDGVNFGDIFHRLTVHGDIENAGGLIDMRRGSSGVNASFIDLVFAGDEDSMITLGEYDNDNNQLFRVTVAKTNGASIILGSDIQTDNNSQAQLTLESGYIDTGDFKVVVTSNNSQVVVGGSPASYVIGELARGLPKGTVTTQQNRFYPVGDAAAYRPATVYVTERTSDDQVFGVRVVPGDADTGSSVFEGGLMDVSPVRSFAFTSYEFDTLEDVVIDAVEISYGLDDQIADGSTDFVVATSTDDRATWVNSDGLNPDDSDHTTSVTAAPTAIKTMLLDATDWTFEIGFDQSTLEYIYETNYAAVGTTGQFGTAGESRPEVGAFALSAYPNPSTGAATLTFELAEAGEVTLEVFDMLGRRVATLANGARVAGPQQIDWNAGSLASGLYMIRLQTATGAASRTLTLSR